MATVDEGLFAGNYEDYLNDDVARQREIDLLGDDDDNSVQTSSDTASESVSHPGSKKNRMKKAGAIYIDHAFPADGRSLYFDPINPPKGSIPQSCIEWNRICSGDIVGCTEPVLFCNNSSSAEIEEGALGDSYFVNSLRLLASASSVSTKTDFDGVSQKQHFISRLLVSSKNASKGIYTFKFFKAGSWRYVHIDDRIPCRQSGKVNFCRNKNPNETFAMLLEKAYAKLHGCYEALVYGVVGKCLFDMTPGANITTLKSEHFTPLNICNEIWDHLDENLRNRKHLGCTRVVPDPYTEQLSDRKGISLNHMYQVVAVCIATAEATESLNALTVGMVCIRNLQVSATGGGNVNIGRYVGRWSYGHPLWIEYPAIGEVIRQKTREIMFHRGLGVFPGEATTDADFPYEHPGGRGHGTGEGNYSMGLDETMVGMTHSTDSTVISTYDPLKSLTLMEADDNDYGVEDMIPGGAAATHGTEPVQPKAPDLIWLQIDDFVSMFNRVYIVDDLSFNVKYASKKFVSKWIPGDEIVGSGGPPFLFPKVLAIPPLPPPVDITTTNPSAANMDGTERYDIPSGRPATAVEEEIEQDQEDGKEDNGVDGYLNHDQDGNDDEEEGEEDEEDEEEDEEEEEDGETSQTTESTAKRKKKKSAIEVHGDEDDLLAISELENALKSHTDQHNDIKAKRKVNDNILGSGSGNHLNHSASASGLQNHYNNLQNNQMASTAGIDDAGNTVPMSYTTDGNVNDENGSTKIVGVNGLENNLKQFGNNPIYSMIVNEPCSLILSLYQSDRRWSVMRLSEGIGASGSVSAASSGINNPRDITSSEFSFRTERLASCMKYPIAIGFCIIKLSGTHSRFTNYRHRKVVATSYHVEYSNVVSGGTINLRPGRYAIVPYTHEILDRSMSYVLHAQYLLGQIDFENEDLVDERPDDDSGSEDDPDTDSEEHVKRQPKQPNMKPLRGQPKAAKVVLESDDEDYESEEEEEEDEESEDEETKQKRREAIAAASIDERVFPPTLLVTKPTIRLRRVETVSKATSIASSSDADWEWIEDTHSEAFTGMYEEIGEISKLIFGLRKDLKKVMGKK